MAAYEELAGLGFVRAGAIRPDGGGKTCRCEIEDMRGCVVYVQLVDGVPMKFGSTTPALKARMSQNASTIRQVIALLDGKAERDALWHHRPFDAFKRLAPQVIRSGREIEVWAVQKGSIGACQDLERELNGRYRTMDNGWATRLA